MDKYFRANAVLSVFSKRYMDLKKGLPIRPSEMGVLNIISQREGQYTPVNLAEMLGVSKPMITAHITSLVNKEYVTKEPSEYDKRAYYIIPTEKGLELVQEAHMDMIRQIDQLRDGLGQEDFDMFLKLTQKVNEIMGEKQ